MSTRTSYHMSLSYVILNKFELNSHFYACPENWTMSEEERVKSPIFGTYLMVSGTIYVILYILCLITMFKRELIRHPAYKIMVCLALFDIPSLFIACIFTGYFGYFGIYFCDYPRLIFVLGSFGFGLWMGCSFSCSALALCRISGVNPNLRIKWIFRSPCIYFLILLIFLLPFYGSFFTEALIFRPEYMSWFFDPGTGLVDSSKYHNISQAVNNEAESVVTTLLYAYLLMMLESSAKSYFKLP
ncbi:hypothetical protein L5515_006598 [Caenorhabditis briggsae]|uniref:Uncharacterized protein n=1 Tax=Caenorhabditis briggsae TaxID=6238 RepID=A0AAE9JIZ9_CAEBR|nr:hypothetical protein L5515_006598 [Caenorhabditis briggsae]